MKTLKDLPVDTKLLSITARLYAGQSGLRLGGIKNL